MSPKNMNDNLQVDACWNFDEGTSVTIDEYTWKKIVNEDNLVLKNNHKMTKA